MTEEFCGLGEIVVGFFPEDFKTKENTMYPAT
jgi:hypothetical protein